jgi:hypothetical protein
MRKPLPWLAAGLAVLVCPPAQAVSASPAEAARAVLQKNCLSCHGKDQKGAASTCGGARPC